MLRIYGVADVLRLRGRSVLVLPWTLTLPQRRAMLARFRPDIVVMQSARHPLNRPALYPDAPVVYDIDDADFHLPRFAAPVTEDMGAVSAVIAGSAYIASWCREAGAPEASVVWTGTPVSPGPRPAHRARPPVIAWAQTRPQSYVREAELVRGFARHLAQASPGATLRLYDRRRGDDPGFADSFRMPGLDVEWRETCSYRAYLRSFDDVALGLAPLCPETPFSRGKSFGKVLAYLDRSVPVIGSAVGEHPAFFTDRTGVITNENAGWVEAAARLLKAPDERQVLADRAFEAFEARLSIKAAAERVAAVLTAHMGTPLRAAG